MRRNVLKIIYLIAISVFGFALFFIPIVGVTPLAGGEVTYTFSDLVGGRSPYLMVGAESDAVAAAPAIPLLFALLIPTPRGEENKNRVTLFTALTAATFFLASLLPLMQAASVLLGSGDIAIDAAISRTIGTSFVLYWGLATLFFLVATSIPKVRESVLPPL